MAAVYFPTRADLRARVRTYIAEATQAFYTDTEINYAINDAQQELGVELAQVGEYYFVNPSPTTITPVVNQPTYSLATDLYKLVRVEIQSTGEQVPMIDINEKSIDNLAIPPLVNTAGYGAGMQAYLVGNSIGFTPPPTDPSLVFQYWYIPILPDLTADTDVTNIPRSFVDICAIIAAIDMLIKDEDDTTPLERKLARKIEQAKRAARNRQVQNPKYVRRTQWASPLYPWLQS